MGCIFFFPMLICNSGLWYYAIVNTCLIYTINSLTCLNISLKRVRVQWFYLHGINCLNDFLVHWIPSLGLLLFSIPCLIFKCQLIFATGGHSCTQFSEWYWSRKLGYQFQFNQWIMPKIQYSYDQLSYKVTERFHAIFYLLVNRDFYSSLWP